MIMSMQIGPGRSRTARSACLSAGVALLHGLREVADALRIGGVRYKRHPQPGILPTRIAHSGCTVFYR